MGFIANLISSLSNKAIITYKKQLTPDTYHIRIQAEDLKKVEYIPGHFIRVLVGKDKHLSFDDNIRSYSVWEFDKQTGTIDMAVCVHAKGSGSVWARESKVGEMVSFRFHKSNLKADKTAEHHLFIGDLSALSHLYAIRRELSDTIKIQSIIHGAGIEDFFPDIDNSTPFQYYDFEHDASADIISQIPELIKDFSPDSVVYIAGDSRVCVAVHNYFRKELKWETRRIKAKPFWNPVKKGLE